MQSINGQATRRGVAPVSAYLKQTLAAALAALAVAAPSATAQTTTPAAGETAPGYRIVDRIPIPDGWWDSATVETANRMLFVTRGNGVLRFEIDRGLMDYRFIPGLEGRAVIPVGTGETMMFTASGYSSVIFFSTVEGKVAKLIQLDQAADGAAYDPATKRVWAMGVRGRISIIDPMKLEVAGTLDAGESLESAASDGRGRIFAAASDSGSVFAFDTATQKVAAKWKLNDCIAPHGIAYVAESDVVLTACFDNKLKMLDARTGRELASVPVGKGSEAVIHDPTTRRVFIPSAYDGLLTVLQMEGRTIRVTETVPTQIGTRTGAVDPKTGTLYLPTGRMGPVHKLGWPEPLPGTVELLVMKPR